jgi:AAA15 family ATPase/GTPase
MIFRLANSLNIQVFATTHNWECIEAFQKVAVEEKQIEGMLIRLSLKQGEIRATLFDQEDLQIVTRERIEVR